MRKGGREGGKEGVREGGRGKKNPVYLHLCYSGHVYRWKRATVCNHGRESEGRQITNAEQIMSKNKQSYNNNNTLNS